MTIKLDTINNVENMTRHQKIKHATEIYNRSKKIIEDKFKKEKISQEKYESDLNIQYELYKNTIDKINQNKGSEK